MQVKLTYSRSAKLLNDYLVQTGKRLADNFITAELEALTADQRAVIVRCGIDHAERVNMPGVVVGVQPTGYNAPRLESKSAPELDTIPTVDEWLTMAGKALATADRYQPELDALIAAQKAEKRARRARIDELHSTYKAMQAEWSPRIDTMSEAEANHPLPEAVRYVETELRQLQAELSPVLSTVKSARWKELSSARIKAEADAAKQSWITVHGSDHLKRAHAGGYDCTRKYVIERAAYEAPGFTVDIEDHASWGDRSCPSAAALDAADAATALGLGDAVVVWLKVEPSDTKSKPDYYSYDEPFEQCEAVVIRGYLGKYDLVKTL